MTPITRSVKRPYDVKVSIGVTSEPQINDQHILDIVIDLKPKTHHPEWRRIIYDRTLVDLMLYFHLQPDNFIGKHRVSCNVQDYDCGVIATFHLERVEGGVGSPVVDGFLKTLSSLTNYFD